MLRCHREVTSNHIKSNAHGAFPDRNYRVWDLVRAHNSMIRGHFGLEMVWSEVTSVWGLSDQMRSKAHISRIRGDFELIWVWSETISKGIVFDLLFFLRQQKEAFWSQTHQESDCFDQNQIGLLIANAGPLKGKSWLTVQHNVCCYVENCLNLLIEFEICTKIYEINFFHNSWIF